MESKKASSLLLNPVINQVTDAAVNLIDAITKSGFSDYSLPRSITKCINIPSTRDELIEALQQEPTNVIMHEKLMEIYKDNFEMNAYSIQEEIVEMLSK